jgi:hypothetical protein
MTIVLTRSPNDPSGAKSLLPARAAQIWFLAALAGQTTFVYYIVAFYGPTVASGDFSRWSHNPLLIKGYQPGDASGNLTFLVHALMATAVTLGGLLQLVPQVRARAPAVHRWIGRMFLVASMLGAASGTYMVIVRHAYTSELGAVALLLDAALILVFSVLAWRAAISRRFASHKRWALRTFIVANGVWFTRVGFIPVDMLKRAFFGSAATNPSAFEIWGFGAYLLPLAVLELYLRTAGGRGGPLSIATSVLILGLTMVMAAGSIAFWLQVLQPVLGAAAQ